MHQRIRYNICFISLKKSYVKYCIRNFYHTFEKQNNRRYLWNIKKYSQMINENVKDKAHAPIMAKEVLQYLEPSPGKVFIDMTFGAGGHSTKILESAPDVKIFALDRDPVAYEYAQNLAKKYPGQVIPLLGRFSELPELLCKHKMGANSVDGFLFDFGCSSMQYDVAERGFSLSKNGPLDMRMDGCRCPEEPTAADVLQTISEKDLYQILKIYGEEKQAKKIANAIINARYGSSSLKTTWELASFINIVISDKRFNKLRSFSHNAMKTFLALRIFVNNEFNEINYGIILAGSYLKVNGRLITISFHSLEDTIVKRHMSGNISDSVANRVPLRYADHSKVFNINEMENVVKTPWKMLHKHVMIPTVEEITENPRARSAKFRAMSKVI